MGKPANRWAKVQVQIVLGSGNFIESKTNKKWQQQNTNRSIKNPPIKQSTTFGHE